MSDTSAPDYKLGQDNITPFGLDIHNPVFAVSAMTIVVFVVFTMLFQTQAAEFFGWLRSAITDTFDWFLLSVANIFVIFALFLCVSPLGKIRLGGPDATPEFGYIGWFSMLFAAGMGIGLVFFGVSEPISHFETSLSGIALENGVRIDFAPLGGAQGNAEAARNLAMAATIFHWGLHPWAIYAVVGLALAFFTYNRNMPMMLRSAFYPLLGDRVWGWPGHIIDITAVFATLFGLTTSLGYGTTQALAGLNFLFGWGTGPLAMFTLVAVVTCIALISVLRGLDGGVKVLSEINMLLALLLLSFIVLVGPTWEILSTMFYGAGAYLGEIVPLSMPFGREDVHFSRDWTAFYWTWWISWSPFVGMFIARVSRGRTVREFVLCVMILPTLLSIIWMSALGGTAITQIIADANAPVAAAAQELKLFEMVKAFPFTNFLSIIGIVLVLVFFITSSDSGSLVIDTITAGGKEDAPLPQRVFWCTFIGIVAIVLLLAGNTNALSALQAMAVSTGVLFAVVLLGMCVSLYLGLHKAARTPNPPD